MERTEELTQEQLHKSEIRKKAIIFISCLAVCLVLLLMLTRTQYKTPEMRGKVEYDPALFNTVLLGKLIDTDITVLGDVTSETYMLIDPYDSTKSGLTQLVTGKKAAASLNVSANTELGNKQTTGEFSKVAPGDTQGAYVPFTVTNGTTVQDDETNPFRTKNVAESDIRYTIHIITTENLPLTYQIQDLDSNKIYNLREYRRQSGETTGDYKDYVIVDSQDQSENDDETLSAQETGSGETETPVFRDGSRILKCNADGSITVHRYKLLVSWIPRAGENNQDTSDLKYMKELENVEIRVEVESFVNYLDKTTEQQQGNKAEGLMVIKGEPVLDSFYTVKGLGTNEKIFASKTVRFDNLSYGNSSGNYSFRVCNADAIVGQWNETEKRYEETGTSYQAGDYRILVAVPTGELIQGSEFPQDATVTLTCNGVTYTGERMESEANPNIGVYTEKQEKSPVSEGSNKYRYETAEVKAYELYRFYPAQGESQINPQEGDPEGGQTAPQEFKLTMESNKFQEAELTLTFGGITTTRKKDDFRIYVYKEIQTQQTDPTVPPTND